MLRLTLRSGRDGRLLARIVERDGVLFVLDYGDPQVVLDASRRVLHGGFGIGWEGETETALPGHPALLRQLALHYAEVGLLVFIDEPGYPRDAMADMPVVGVGEEQTELLSKIESARLRAGRPTPAGPARREAAPTLVPRADERPLEPVPLPLGEVEEIPTEEITAGRTEPGAWRVGPEREGR